MEPKQYPLIPDEAFLFLPPPQQIKTGRSRNFFEGGVEFNPDEKQKLAEFDAYIKQRQIKLEPYWNPSNRLKFMQATGFQYDKTVTAMQEYLTWRRTKLPTEAAFNIRKHLERGMLYFCGRDCHYRPILVIDVKKMVDSNISDEDGLDMLGFFFNYVIENMMIEGQVEMWIVIIDLGKTGMLSAGGKLKKAVSFLSDTFRCRMKYSYLVRCPGSMYMFWGGIKKFLQQETVNKIMMEDEAEPKQIWTHTNRSQIERKFGGSMEDIKDYWPPKLRSMDFHVGNSKSLLMSPEDYRKMYENGQLRQRKINFKFVAQKPTGSNKVMADLTSQPTFNTFGSAPPAQQKIGSTGSIDRQIQQSIPPGYHPQQKQPSGLSHQYSNHESQPPSRIQKQPSQHERPTPQGPPSYIPSHPSLTYSSEHPQSQQTPSGIQQPHYNQSPPPSQTQQQSQMYPSRAVPHNFEPAPTGSMLYPGSYHPGEHNLQFQAHPPPPGDSENRTIYASSKMDHTSMAKNHIPSQIPDPYNAPPQSQYPAQYPSVHAQNAQSNYQPVQYPSDPRTHPVQSAYQDAQQYVSQPQYYQTPQAPSQGPSIQSSQHLPQYPPLYPGSSSQIPQPQSDVRQRQSKEYKSQNQAGFASYADSQREAPQQQQRYVSQPPQQHYDAYQTPGSNTQQMPMQLQSQHSLREQVQFKHPLPQFQQPIEVPQYPSKAELQPQRPAPSHLQSQHSQQQPQHQSNHSMQSQPHYQPNQPPARRNVFDQPVALDAHPYPIRHNKQNQALRYASNKPMSFDMQADEGVIAPIETTKLFLKPKNFNSA